MYSLHPHMHTSHPRLRLRPWYSEPVHSRIWYPSQIESTRLWLRPWYPDALHPLLWLHPQIASTTDYQTFGSSHRYLHGPQWHVREWYSALPPRPVGQKKTAMATRNIREHGLTNFNVKSLVVRHEVAPATVPPHLWIPYLPLHAGRVASLPLASFTNCVIPRLSHLRTRLQFLYFPSYFIRYCQLKFSISNLWSANNIINQRPVPDSKEFKNHWPRQSIHARIATCTYVMFDDGDGEGYEWWGLAVGPWDIIHGFPLRVPRAPHWVNPALRPC